MRFKATQKVALKRFVNLLKLLGYLFGFAVLIQNIKQIIKMKNSIKIAALALVIGVSFAACKGSSSSSTSDTTKTADTTKTTTVDTTKKADTAKMAADTAKKDTTKKK
ncbi:MAG TPA: hypothetical protein VHE59_13185 [Mucilaginibacter sp.]|nr:hypothetical protein [Mucilaginibacter sp.]